MRRYHFLFLCATTMSLYAGASRAQQAAAEATLSEVVVTAERRVENVQKTPIAITALSGDELERQGVRDVLNLDRVSPDVRLYSNSGGTVVSIRGIRASANGPSTEQPVVLNLDGVYLGRSNSTGGLLFDVDRVEVLLGPQGTLYGRNATAGAVNVVTRKPGSEFSADAELEFGSYQRTRFYGAVTIPVSNTFSLRVAGQSNRHLGYFKSGAADADQTSTRVTALWKPSDRDQLLMSADYANVGGKALVGLNVIAASTGNPVPSDFWDDTTYYGGTKDYLKNNQRSWGLMAQYDHQFDGTNLTIQGAHRDFKQDNTLALLFFPGFTAGAAYPGYAHQNSLEARLASSGGGPVKWVAGLYGFTETVDGRLLVSSAPAFNAVFFAFDQNYSDDKSYAAFGQATWSVTSVLRLTGGLRYSHDQKDGIIGTLLGPTGPYLRVADSGAWSATNFRAAIDYDLSPKNMIYASVATGYKAGGFAFGITPRYNPEKVTAFEIGSKNRFRDDAVQLNLSAFKYRYRDFEIQYTAPTVLQPPVVPATTTVNLSTVTNIGGANNYGASADLQWAVTSHDRINATLSYLHAYYAGNDQRPLGLQDYSGQPMQNTAPAAGTLAYQHAWAVRGGQLDAQLRAIYTAERHINQFSFVKGTLPGTTNQPDIIGPSSTTLDFSLRYEADNKKWNVTAYVTNLTNKLIYNNAQYAIGPTGWAEFAQPSDPRLVGIVLGTHF